MQGMIKSEHRKMFMGNKIILHLPRILAASLIFCIICLIVKKSFSTHKNAYPEKNKITNNGISSKGKSDYYIGRPKIENGSKVDSTSRPDVEITFKSNYMARLDDETDSKGKSDSTGRLFKGEKIRNFTKELDKFQMRRDSVSKTLSDLHCEKWAVLTTINEPSEAVRRFSYDPSWCLIIVGDKDSHKKAYKLKSSLGSNIIYLNDKDQVQIGSSFVNALPWKSFGRKNVGYFFAIAHGAKIIYDFDDDNMHKFWIPNALQKQEFKSINDFKDISDTVFKTFEPSNKSSHCPAFNPYPYLGGPSGSWPRGFPLDCLRGSNEIYKKSMNKDLKINENNPLGLLQSLAENEPDVDAIYRLTQKTPFNFKPHNIQGPGIILPYGIYSPYNAQATLQYPPGFWALYLPISVSGRVSDILRSYVAKRLFDIFKIRVGFISYPLVVQIRNSHNFLGDFNAEIPLYKKVSVLLKYLESYQPKPNEFAGDIILKLWIGLFERGYVEEKDVMILHKWLQALLDIGYQFPHQNKNISSSKSSEQIHYNFKIGSNVVPNQEKSAVNCIKKKRQLWSPDNENAKYILPLLDSSLTLTELNQEVLIGSTKGSGENGNTDKKVSSLISGSKNDILKMSKNIKEYRLSQSAINNSEAIYCHMDLSACLEKSLVHKIIGYIPGRRYNSDQCKEDEWKSLNANIMNLNKDKYLVGSTNRFDGEYLRHFTNVEPKLFPPVGFVNEETQYNKKNKKTLLYMGNQAFLNKFKTFSITNETLNQSIADKILGIIYVPSEVSSYDLHHAYSYNIPIFAPSIEFLKKNKILQSMMKVCKSIQSVPSYTQTWHPFDPSDDQNAIAQIYWSQLSDTFDLPHITYFNNEEDLKNKINTVDFNKIGKNMKVENSLRKIVSKESWCSLLSRTTM